LLFSNYCFSYENAVVLKLSKTLRVRKWKEFKQLAGKLKPKAIVYSIDQNGTTKTKELTCLRLILPTQNACYIYIDFPKGKKLRETEIPIIEKKDMPRYLEDQDIIVFLKKQLQREDLKVYSFWTA